MAGEFLLWPTRVEASPQSTPVATVTQSGFRADNFGDQVEPPRGPVEGGRSRVQALLFVQEKDQAERIGQRLAQDVSSKVRTLHANKGRTAASMRWTC